MAVQCAKCGEELMGSVNRCWRCGQEFVAHRSETGLPPIRRAPPLEPASELFVAEFANGGPSSLEQWEVVNAPNRKQASSKIRRGSPFADRGTAIVEAIDPDLPQRLDNQHRATELRYQKRGGAAASAILSLPVGIISFVLAFQLPIAGVLLALLGVGLGVWGLRSRRRGFVVTGLLICSVSLAIAIFNGSIDFYVSRYGVAPWESSASIQ